MLRFRVLRHDCSTIVGTSVQTFRHWKLFSRNAGRNFGINSRWQEQPIRGLSDHFFFWITKASSFDIFEETKREILTLHLCLADWWQSSKMGNIRIHTIDGTMANEVRWI